MFFYLLWNYDLIEGRTVSAHCKEREGWNREMEVRELFVNDRHAIAITSMTKLGGKLYLGLTGGTRCLASYDIAKDEIVMESEIFPWIEGRGYCGKIHNAMGALGEDSLLLGEGNHFTWDGIPVTSNYLSKELPESMLYRKRGEGFPEAKFTDFCLTDLSTWDRRKSDPGGKILRYGVNDGTVEVVCSLPDYLYVQTMVTDPVRQRAYGCTIPDNHFFSLDLTTGVLTDFGHISDYANHNLVVAPDGVCRGAWIDRSDGSMKLLQFDPGKDRLEYSSTVILKDPGSKIAGNLGIDQWLVASNGKVYMGTVANSLLFEFHYEEERFGLLGQLAPGGRVTSMDEDEEGIIWIGAGYPNMHLVRFDPKASGRGRLIDCGPVNSGYERCYFHASSYANGKLYLGETDGFSPSLHIIDLHAL